MLKEREIKQYGEYRTRRLVLEAWDRLGLAPRNRDGQYLTVDEVAEKLAVTPQTVHNWIKDRRLFAVRFSDRVVRIPRRSVETFHYRMSDETRRRGGGR